MKLGINRSLTISVFMTVFVGILGGALAVVTNTQLHNAHKRLAEYKAISQESLLAKEMQLQVANVWQFITDASLTRDRTVIENEAQPAYNSAMEIADKLIEANRNDSEHLKHLQTIKEKLPAMRSTGIAMFDAYQKNQVEGDRLMDEYDKACDAVIKSVALVTEKNQKDSDALMNVAMGTVTAVISNLNRATLVNTIVSIGVIVVLLFIRRSIIASLRAVVDVIREMENGNLKARIDNSHESGEIAELGNAVNHTVASFHDIIDNVLTSIQELIHSIDVLKPKAERTYTNACKQAEQSVQVATAAEEMSLTINDISRNCSDAAKVADQALATASEGKRIADSAVASVNSVNTASNELATLVDQLNNRVGEIGGIVSVIEDIADQTNLLALNAAIEAARAGDQGRGFAVVADEVRALAERTIKATREISERISLVQGDSSRTATSMAHASSEVAATTHAISAVGNSLQTILGSVNSLRDQIAQVATAVEEQSATTTEVSHNVEQTAHIAKDIESIAVSLKSELNRQVETGEKLRDCTAGFKTTGRELMILDIAKADHRMFVEKISGFLQGDVDLKADQLPDHHTCRFGKWYDSEGTEKCGTLSSFRSIESPHARIHSLAKDAVNASSSGDKQQASKLYDEIEQLSREIGIKIDTLKSECKRG